MDPLDCLILDNPAFHHRPDGTPENWAVDKAALRFIRAHLSSGMNTLETGAGQTTVVFAMAGTNHVCITPQIEHTIRVLAYCDGRGIRCRVCFIHESSDAALPRHPLIPDRLDFVLIDGAHRFPFPCLDWHYTQHRLRVGGLLGVDDYAMPSVRILHDFLCGEKEWQLVEIAGRTSFFKKVGEADLALDCRGQKINQVAYSYLPIPP